VRSQAEHDFLTSSLPDFEFLGFLPYDQAIVDADLAGRPLFQASPRIFDEVKNIYQALLAGAQA
jgi:CO dehydrogenase maturation factor